MKNLKSIIIFGDRYFLKRTFDILHYCALEGFDVLNENKKLLFHYDTNNRDSIISEIKWKIYRNFNLE